MKLVGAGFRSSHDLARKTGAILRLVIGAQDADFTDALGRDRHVGAERNVAALSHRAFLGARAVEHSLITGLQASVGTGVKCVAAVTCVHAGLQDDERRRAAHRATHNQRQVLYGLRRYRALQFAIVGIDR